MKMILLSVLGIYVLVSVFQLIRSAISAKTLDFDMVKHAFSWPYWTAKMISE